jgi:hypothetical protein
MDVELLKKEVRVPEDQRKAIEAEITTRLHTKWFKGYIQRTVTGDNAAKPLPIIPHNLKQMTREINGKQYILYHNIAVPDEDLLPEGVQLNTYGATHALLAYEYFPNDVDIAKAGEYIHIMWLKNNTWAKSDPKLGVDYNELTPEEQEKDTDQWYIARDVIREMGINLSAEPSVEQSAEPPAEPPAEQVAAEGGRRRRTTKHKSRRNRKSMKKRKYV